jgi:aminoglycoside phosphotransferase (APT) family kinase protein
VLGSIAGAPRVAQLLQARIRGTEPPSDAPPLEEAVATCGRIAAALHRVEMPLARSRTLDGELAGLRESIDVVRRYSGELAARLEPAMVSARSCAAGTQRAADVTAHGDFSYTQLLFSRDRKGLVDFDGVCRAEPALDLGRFLAYLRFATVKAAGADAPRFALLEDELEAAFLDAYRSAGGPSDVVDDRIRVHETVSLLQLAVHAWQKLKLQRLGRILAVLDARRALTT